MIKRSNTKQLLAESLLDLAASKSINKIHVRDITDNCEISYPMFYYYYKDMDDLINSIFREDVEKKLEDEPEVIDYEWTLNRIAEVIHEKSDFYLNVLQNTSGVNSLYNYSAKYLLEYFEERMSKQFEYHEIPEHLKTMLEFHVMGIRSKTCDMIVNGTLKTREFIINAFTDALPSDLRPYLLSQKAS